MRSLWISRGGALFLPWLAAAALIAALGAAATPAHANPVRDAFSKPGAARPVVLEHADWSRLLRRYVSAGRDGINRVDFAAWKQGGTAALEGYVASLEKADPTMLSRAGQLAYWINLYNARTVLIVLQRYPVGSIREINLPDPAGKPADGPWKAKVATVNGIALSLDDVENEIVRPIFKDARVHYAFNCLSIGCPNLLREAYTAARLERQLERAARDFINDQRGIAFKAGKVTASSIYEWFEGDFGGFPGVVAHLRSYARPGLRKQIDGLKKIDAYDYDWKLIDTRK